MWQTRLWHKAAPISVLKIHKCIRKICIKRSGIRRLISAHINSIQYIIQYIPINTVQQKREQLYQCEYISAISMQVEWMAMANSPKESNLKQRISPCNEQDWSALTLTYWVSLPHFDSTWVNEIFANETELNWTEVGRGYFGTGYFVNHDSR